ncbi:transcriptional regulator [Vulcanibacillus modesticaldus]|uniref:Transcriptional regulator CtsR n=1 Tax=Vulcanibacillus modesticaldus TaxID=337097 RepID=A0A1D2YRY9_9BACI|nr:CtsR family transcriptional regulator [Vulcanibacillus modesticaldus]OEF96383.1 transcriptional regulator [Vulcanibacillus modesticaldus]
MRNISDIIENFLKSIIELSEDGVIEVQRSALAEKFQCVPSQINYVISTRFSLEKGFLVESKRGGGGYIRIKKLEINSDDQFYETLINSIGEDITQATAVDLLDRLKEEQYLSNKEYRLVKAIIAREVLDLPLPIRDKIRANIFKAVIRIIFSK